MRRIISNKPLVVIIVLLVIFIVINGVLWQQLSGTIAQLGAVKPGMDSLQAERDQLLSDYARLRNEVNLRGGYKRNGPYMLDPDDSKIAALVQEITGGYSEEELWKDYARLYQWTMRNIEYSLDSPTAVLPESVNGTLGWIMDFWRTPAETIEHGTGDCEDLSVLLASMMLNYNQRQFPVLVLGIQTIGDNATAHVAVAILNEGDLLSIFDVTSRYWTPFSEVGGFGAQPIPEALDHWFNHLGDEMPDAQVYEIFSEDYYLSFTGNQQFIDWASSVY